MKNIKRKEFDIINDLIELIKFPVALLDKKSNIISFNSVFKNIFLEDNNKEGIILLDIVESEENKDKIKFFLNNPFKSPFLANVSKEFLHPFINNLLNILNNLEIKSTNLTSINVIYKESIFELFLIRIFLNSKELFLAIFTSPKETDSKNLKNLILLNKEIEFLNKKIEILANITNKVLTTTKAFTETLLNGYYKDPIISKNLISIIDKEVKEAIKIILNILTLNVIEELNLNKQKINAYNYFLDIAQNFKSKVVDFNSLNSKNIIFEYFIQPNLPSIFIDIDKFTLAINNILDNSLKFQDFNKEKNYIDFKVFYESDEDFINIIIKDNGIGIEDVNKIGEPFKTFSSKSGLGLGLFVSINILKAHNCKIQISSIVNEQTTFNIKLPIK
jgi:signal transduction histidine kinase